MDTKNIGYLAEGFVSQHLECVGFTILERNYRKSYGEIDIIAHKNSLLIFVEVKMRINAYFDPAELITPSKQRKIIAVAQEYIDRKTNGNMDCRFDVALVEFENNEPHITYLTDAFGAS
ncbi:YraN family protein [Candidatus Dependentiae bacterium HGW-Dependentiae-1]|nr:MAG: YraN family protein [Candidatus Dependentiae bacterium HGW-Dependentiae-1]